MSSPACAPGAPRSIALSGRTFALVAILLFLPLHAAAQQVLPAPPILPGFGGLCDGGPLPCTRMDQVALNAHADALIASGTDRRDFLFLSPYELSIAVLERLEVGLATHTAGWRQDGEIARQQGPLRIDLKGLLWPWRRDPHRRFAVAAAFQYEGRAGPFDGQNQLGRFTDLGSLRLILNQPIGLAEVGLVGGGLWDWQGRYGTAELGARAGLHLPWLDIKVFTEGLLRGLPAINSSEELPAIGPQGVLAFGLISRASRAVDIAVVVNVTFGELAPFFVNVRLLDIGIGEGYPRPQGLLIEMAKEIGAWIRTWPIDPYLKRNCTMYDDDGRPMAHLGVLAPDGRHCQWQGQKLPIGVHFWRDRRRTRICHDRRLQDCFMQRAGPQAPWTPIERPVLHGDCYLYEGRCAPAERAWLYGPRVLSSDSTHRPIL
jgi:hypothetical protein